jgi:hypothetical protein
VTENERLKLRKTIFRELYVNPFLRLFMNFFILMKNMEDLNLCFMFSLNIISYLVGREWSRKNDR